MDGIHRVTLGGVAAGRPPPAGHLHHLLATVGRKTARPAPKLPAPSIAQQRRPGSSLAANASSSLYPRVGTGAPEKGQEVLQPLRELGTPLLDPGAEMPFRMFQAVFDAFFPKGQLASYWKSI